MKKNLILFLLLLAPNQLAHTMLPLQAALQKGDSQPRDKTFWEKHKNKLIGSAIVGSTLLACFLRYLHNRTNDPNHRQNNTDVLTTQQSKKATQKTNDAQEKVTHARSESARKAAQAGLEKEQEKTKWNGPLEALRYELDQEAQKKSFDALWRACKDDPTKRKSFEKAFYETLIGTVEQDEVDKEYVFQNKNTSSNTAPPSFQEAQEIFHKKYGTDTLTPFDKYAIARDLRIKGTFKPRTIYEQVKALIEQRTENRLQLPTLAPEDPTGKINTFEPLKDHPELLTVTSEIRALITPLLKKDEYNNSDVFNLYKLGMSIRKNPDTPLNRAQREMLYNTTIAADQAPTFVLKGAEKGNETSIALKQALECLSTSKEVTTIAFAMERSFMERSFLDNSPEKDRFNLLAESMRDTRTNAFKENLFNEAVTHAEYLLEEHTNEPDYAGWQTKMKERLKQRVDDMVKADKQKLDKTAHQEKITQLTTTIKNLISLPDKVKEQLPDKEYEEKLKKPFSELTEEEKRYVIQKAHEHWSFLWSGWHENNAGIPDTDRGVFPYKYKEITVRKLPNYGTSVRKLPNYGTSVLKLFNENYKDWSDSISTTLKPL